MSGRHVSSQHTGRRAGKMAVLAVAVAAMTSAAAWGATKPAKWMWTIEKVQTRLTAANPNLGLDGNYRLFNVRCQGRSRAVAGRFTAFRCSAAATDSNNTIGVPIFVKIKPVGSGKLCVSRESFAAIPPDCLAVP